MYKYIIHIRCLHYRDIKLVEQILMCILDINKWILKESKLLKVNTILVYINI